MTWRDPESVWRRQMRRRRWIALFVPANFLGAAMFAVVVLALFLPPQMSAMLTFAVIAPIFAISIILSALWAVFVCLKSRRIEGLIIEHDGRICPRCVIPLGSPRGSDGDRPLLCPSCRTTADHETLIAYWEQYALAPAAAKVTKRTLAAGKTGVQPNDAAIAVRRMRWGASFLVVWVIAIFGLIGAFSWWRGFAGPIELALSWSPTVLMLGGMAIGWLGFRAVDPARRFCSACQYERVPEGEGGVVGYSARCPECGAEWMAAGGTVAGRVRPRPMIVGLGIVMFLAGVSVPLMRANLGSMAPRLTPTSMLLTQIIEKRGFNVAEWTELRTRQITPEQQIALTDGLLRKRRERGAVIMDDATWLENTLATGAMNDDQRRQFYRDMAEVRLVAPERMRVGESSDIRVKPIVRNSFITTPEAIVIVNGFFVGDDPEPRSRRVQSIGAIMLDKETTGIEPSPRLSITPDQSGTLRIAFEYWLLAVPSGAGSYFRVQWNDDGTPVIPEYVEWSERRSVEVVVEVAE